MYDQKLIEKLERELQENPKAYQSKVTMLAIIGNIYIAFGILILLVLLIVSCLSILVLKALAIKIIAIVGVFLFVVIRSLWVSVAPPTGIKVSSDDVPELFTIIDHLSQKLNSPKFNHVLITDDFNAAVVQRPRLGILGWYESYLMIGLPLMQSLTVEQLTAVLAHEFGHLSKNHGRTANWIYRQRIRWAQLFTEIEQKASHVDIIFRPFLKRFVPYFVAYSFPIARANEYEADRTSAELTSPEIVAETLSTVNVIGLYLEENYWPKIFNQADTLSHPNVSPYTGYVKQLSDDIAKENTHQWLNDSLRMQTNFEDTHPSLSDRLKSIGQTAKVRYALNGQAADLLLGKKRTEIAAEFDQKWQVQILDTWKNYHQSIQEKKEYLAQLNDKMDHNFEISLEERFDKIELTDEIAHQPDRAFQLIQQLHQEEPENARANFIYGRYLIQQGNPQGIVCLEKAMQLDEFAIFKSCELLYQYYDKQGDISNAAKYQQRLEQRAELEYNAMNERESVSAKDPLCAHNLSRDQLNDFLGQITRFSNIKQVCLVKKQMTFLPHLPCYVMGFSIKQGFMGKVSEQAVIQTMQILHEQVKFPGETFLVCLDLVENKALHKKMKKLPNAVILNR